MEEKTKKKVLIISSSFRKNGNSETLAHQFEKGATESGHEVEFKGLVHGGGTTNVGDILNKEDILNKAYETGKIFRR